MEFMDSTTLDSNYKEVIRKFNQDYCNLRAIFNISIPNKVHLLQELSEDQLDMTGEGFGEVDDITAACLCLHV